MQITETLSIENDGRDYQNLCSDCEAYGEPGLTRSDCTWKEYDLVYGSSRGIPRQALHRIG